MNVITHYDRLITENNDPFRDPPVLKEYMDKWDGREFLDAMKLDRTKSVLEIGVGTGRLAARVIPHCLHFTGIDISPLTIERAKENLSVFGNISLICADFSEYGFDCMFDVIYSSLTMMHFENKQAVISKTASLLKDDGIFCLSIDKNRRDVIDMGSYSLKIYPDDPNSLTECIKTSALKLDRIFETEFAHIFICTK